MCSLREQKVTATSRSGKITTDGARDKSHARRKVHCRFSLTGSIERGARRLEKGRGGGGG